jgi:hypothetical protein
VGKAGNEWLGWRCGCYRVVGGMWGLGVEVEAGGRETDRCGVGAVECGEVEGVRVRGDEYWRFVNYSKSRF